MLVRERFRSIRLILSCVGSKQAEAQFPCIYAQLRHYNFFDMTVLRENAARWVHLAEDAFDLWLPCSQQLRLGNLS